MRGDNWDDLRFILAVARSGTIASAARRLVVDEATVARRIARFEKQVGARMFDRAGRHARPTTAGVAVIRAAAETERALASAREAIRADEGEVAGTVRVTSVPLVVNRLLIPELARLIEAHPRLTVDLIGVPRTLSLSDREADIALRLARPQAEPRALTRRIGYFDYAIFGSRARDPSSLPWLGYGTDMADLPQARAIAQLMAAQDGPIVPILANDADMLMTAVECGLGKTLLPVAIAGRNPELVRLSPELAPPIRRELWLLVHPDVRDTARVCTVVQWVEDRVRRAQRGDLA